MPAARRPGCRVISRRALRCALFAGLVLAAMPALACRTDPPARAPAAAELLRQAGLAAIIRDAGLVPVSAVEQALAERQRRDLPFNTPSLPPAPGATSSAVRALKGAMPAVAVIQNGAGNGAANCTLWLEPGRDHVFFAKLPASDGARLWPLRGTFALDDSADAQARLATVEAALSFSKLTHP